MSLFSTYLYNFFNAKPAPKIQDDPSSHNSDSSADQPIEIKGDQFTNEEATKLLNLKGTDLWALGLTTAIGGHYFAWNAGLTAGFGSFLIALFLVSTSYFAVVLCIAELSSALPFAGGAYGLARVTLGIYPGFIVAVCDSYKSIIYVVSTVVSIGEILTFVTRKNRENEYLYWMAFYVTALAIHAWGGKFYWRFNLALAILSTLILLVFILGAIPFAHFDEYAPLRGEEGMDQWFNGGMHEFVRVLPLASRFFIGIQSINLACGQIKNPKVEVPRAYIGCMTTVMFTSFALLFLCCSLKPGVSSFAARPRPLTVGFKIMFGIPRNRATILNLPATIMSGFGFMYYYGQQLSAMGKSGMLNPCFGWELSGHNTPYVSLFVGTAIGYGLCVLIFHKPDIKGQLYELGVLGAVVTYLSILASFIVFRWYFPTIKREFVSPIGIGGAVYGMLVFLLCFISICGFQEDHIAVIVFAGIIAVSSVYYYFVVIKRQIFSEEEKTVMFKAYLLKGNAAKAERIKRGVSAAVNKARGAGNNVDSNNNSNSTSKTPRSNRDQNQEGSHHSGIAGLLLGAWHSATSSPAGKSPKSDEVRSVRVSATINSKNQDARGVESGVEMSVANGSDVEARAGLSSAAGDARSMHPSAIERESAQNDDTRSGTETYTVVGEKKESLNNSTEASDRIDEAIGSNAQNKKEYTTSDEEQGLHKE